MLIIHFFLLIIKIKHYICNIKCFGIMAKNNIDLSVVLHDTSDYKDWLVELKERFYSHRLKASCATNGYLLDFY